MPSFLFILSRFFLRVDHVLFRIFDVRIYHAFSSKEVLREIRGREATYEDVKRVRSLAHHAKIDCDAIHRDYSQISLTI